MAQTKAQLISGASSQSVTFNDATVSSINGGPIGGARNRIINGDMRIDQRNAGASVNTSEAYIVDRFRQSFGGGGVITGQRSTTAPAGFTNSLQATVTTADSSIAASDYYLIQHRVEGFNVADFGLGAAGAATFTLSFWVRSSVTGTYGVGFANASDNRSYPSTYSVSAANTWEYKTITLTGDTSGTWLKDNGNGMTILFDLGSGSNFNGTSNTWASANTFRTSGCVNWIANSGATFYITGVQLEAGSTATPFERRSYGQELALCHRYFKPFGIGGFGRTGSTTAIEITAMYGITMRTTPTIALGGFPGASTTLDQFGVGPVTVSAVTSTLGNQNGCYLYFTTSGATNTSPCAIIRDDVVSASAEL